MKLLSRKPLFGLCLLDFYIQAILDNRSKSLLSAQLLGISCIYAYRRQSWQSSKSISVYIIHAHLSVSRYSQNPLDNDFQY